MSDTMPGEEDVIPALHRLAGETVKEKSLPTNWALGPLEHRRKKDRGGSPGR